MNCMNINEKIPDYFYIFVDRGSSLPSRINNYNYKLCKTIFSGGFKNIELSPDKIIDFIDGNIIYAPFVPNKTTFLSPTSHTSNITHYYNVEYILEYHRPKKFPSRFSCVYAFGDLETCEKAMKIHPKMFKIENLKKFKLKRFDSIMDDCVKVVKCNMEIVGLMWDNYIESFDSESIESLANGYWMGFGNVMIETPNINGGGVTQKTSGELYEYLIEGVLEEVLD